MIPCALMRRFPSREANQESAARLARAPRELNASHHAITDPGLLRDTEP